MPSSTHHLADAAATRALGRALAARWLALAAAAGERPLLLLQGDLGAGKTCLVQGLAEGLGITEPVTSPSFALAQHYRGQLAPGPATGLAAPTGAPTAAPTALVHLDLYRLEVAAAADELLAQEEEEAASLGALLAVEWPERLSSPPSGAWQLRLSLVDPNAPEAGRIAELLN